MSGRSGCAVYCIGLGCLVTGSVGLNPTRGMDIFLCFCVVLSCVGKGLCDGLIISPKEFYHTSK
jgi:hypothetical protein